MPDSVTVVALVILSVALTPESTNAATKLGAESPTVSTVIVLDAEAALTLPAMSVCVAVKLCVPFDKPVVAINFEPSYTLTVAPASAVPDSVAFVAAVMWSVALTPVSANVATRIGAAATRDAGAPVAGIGGLAGLFLEDIEGHVEDDRHVRRAHRYEGEQARVARNPNDVRIVWKDNPLPFHPRAKPAAIL